MNITPLHLDILSHYYCSPGNFKGGPISTNFTQDLIDKGMLVRDGGGNVRISIHGSRTFQSILNVAGVLIS